MKTMQIKQIDDKSFIGIVLAKDWWTYGERALCPILITDFVVCKWSNFDDGVNSHIEGKQTIAICRKKEDAELIYNSKK